MPATVIAGITVTSMTPEVYDNMTPEVSDNMTPEVYDNMQLWMDWRHKGLWETSCWMQVVVGVLNYTTEEYLSK